MPVAIAYTLDAIGRPLTAAATVRRQDLRTGTSASVNEVHVFGHCGNSHPYHHERGHLIARVLGGDGSDANNLVGLSDGTNAPLMADVELHASEVLQDNGHNASIYVVTSVDWSGANYNGPATAPWIPGMVSCITVRIWAASADATNGDTPLWTGSYPNGVVKNHQAAGCC